MSDRKQRDKAYDAKRLTRPMINAVRDVDPEVIEQLETIAAHDGSKKEALINAIEQRYKSITKGR